MHNRPPNARSRARKNPQRLGPLPAHIKEHKGFKVEIFHPSPCEYWARCTHKQEGFNFVAYPETNNPTDLHDTLEGAQARAFSLVEQFNKKEMRGIAVGSNPDDLLLMSAATAKAYSESNLDGLAFCFEKGLLVIKKSAEVTEADKLIAHLCEN